VKVTAGFGNGKPNRTLPFGRRALIRGRVHNANGEGVPGAQVCVQGHTTLQGRTYRLLATPTTNDNGGWTWKVNRGASRAFRIGYRAGSNQVTTELNLHVRAHATLKVSREVTRVHRPVYFSGHIPGPARCKRVVVLRGTVPGARRSFLVRRARTNCLGQYKTKYAFSPVPGLTKFVFDLTVPEQAEYPFKRGQSRKQFVWVRP
jgi:hypothetical protein